MAILVVACVAVPASAQDTATLFGTVADITGGVLGDVRLEVAGPVRRTVVTGPDGSFQVTALPFGTYRVTVEREGFSTYEETVLLDSSRTPVGASTTVDVVSVVSRKCLMSVDFPVPALPVMKTCPPVE